MDHFIKSEGIQVSEKRVPLFGAADGFVIRAVGSNGNRKGHFLADNGALNSPEELRPLLSLHQDQGGTPVIVHLRRDFPDPPEVSKGQIRSGGKLLRLAVIAGGP